MTKNKKLTNLSFEDKELFILRNAVDNAEKKQFVMEELL